MTSLLQILSLFLLMTLSCMTSKKASKPIEGRLKNGEIEVEKIAEREQEALPPDLWLKENQGIIELIPSPPYEERVTQKLWDLEIIEPPRRSLSYLHHSGHTMEIDHLSIIFEGLLRSYIPLRAVELGSVPDSFNKVREATASSSTYLFMILAKLTEVPTYSWKYRQHKFAVTGHKTDWPEMDTMMLHDNKEPKPVPFVEYLTQKILRHEDINHIGCIFQKWKIIYEKLEDWETKSSLPPEWTQGGSPTPYALIMDHISKFLTRLQMILYHSIIGYMEFGTKIYTQNLKKDEKNLTLEFRPLAGFQQVMILELNIQEETLIACENYFQPTLLQLDINTLPGDSYHRTNVRNQDGAIINTLKLFSHQELLKKSLSYNLLTRVLEHRDFLLSMPLEETTVTKLRQYPQLMHVFEAVYPERSPGHSRRWPFVEEREK